MSITMEEERARESAVARRGLTTAEAQKRLRQYGLNAATEERRHPVLELLGKFWAPVPWMLEITVLLELVLLRYTEAGVILVLLVFNALLSFFQEHRAQNALALLRQRLSVQARVLRDGRWQLLPAQYLVPMDEVHERMGDVVPADLRIDSGQVLLDQSALTGESLPVEAAEGQTAYAGTIVKRGEAGGGITATGTRTAFGKTAELVRLAKTGSHLEEIVFKIVKYLVMADVLLVIAILVYAILTGIALVDILPFALILLVASIPVALPATFTVATALGALELTKHGVLVTRLSAIEEAAGMEVLCSDKTGTITRNELVLTDVQCYPPHTEQEVARLAAMACDESTQDPIDLAILAEARKRGVTLDASQRIRFVPFDPAAKRSESYWHEDGAMLHMVKGAPAVICSLTPQGYETVSQDVERLAAEGARVLAIAAGPENDLHLAGLVALSDPPREDSARLIQHLRDLGVRVVMVTGDSLPTARAVARRSALAIVAARGTRWRKT